MKLKRFLSLVILTCILQGCEDVKPKEFSVMTWNIWHGGTHGSEKDNFEKDSANTIQVLKVLKQHQPDVLLMQETYCCGMEIAKQAGYTYAWRSSSNLSIHSKYPIVDSISIYKPFNSQAAVIDVDGQKVMVVNLWLNYLPDYFSGIDTLKADDIIQNEKPTRLKEITAILNEVDQLNLNIPTVIGGDFNSGSHLDWIESTKEVHHNLVVAWPESKWVMAQGYRDSFRSFYKNPASHPGFSWGYLGEHKLQDRIDYLYYKPEALTLVEAQVINNNPPGGFFNSDHRAMMAKYTIDTK